MSYSCNRTTPRKEVTQQLEIPVSLFTCLRFQSEFIIFLSFQPFLQPESYKETVLPNTIQVEGIRIDVYSLCFSTNFKSTKVYTSSLLYNVYILVNIKYFTRETREITP